MLSISNFELGMKAEKKRIFTSEDVIKFSELSGDINPVHVNEAYAKETIFGKRIVHGALASSIFSTLFANTLPGPGCIYLKSENKFLKPIYLNEEITFSIELVNIIKNKNRLIFDTKAICEDQTYIIGTAEIFIP